MDKYIKKTMKKKVEKALKIIRSENLANVILNDVIPKVLNVFDGVTEKDKIAECKGGLWVLVEKYGKPINKIFDDTIKSIEDEDIKPSFVVKCSEEFIYISLMLTFKGDWEEVLYAKEKYMLRLSGGYFNHSYGFKPFKELDEKEEIKTFKECFRIHDKFENKKREIGLYDVRELI